MSVAIARVAVVDDQRLFADGIRMLIEAQPDMECVGTVRTGADALALAHREHPDVILMDLRMPRMNGIDATRSLLDGVEPDRPPHVIVLTTIRRDEAVYQAFQAGASAFLTKDATPEVMLDAIRRTHSGAGLPDAAEVVDLVHHYAQPADPVDESAPGEQLTAREHEVVLLLARGFSNAEIAAAAYLSEATVKSHLRSVLQKLGLQSRVQVVVYAFEHGLVGRALS